jgi:hypothetical protein
VSDPPPHGTPSAIAAELADVERFLAETPPHHDGDARDRLERRRAALQRKLAAARRQRAR